MKNKLHLILLPCLAVALCFALPALAVRSHDSAAQTAAANCPHTDAQHPRCTDCGQSIAYCPDCSCRMAANTATNDDERTAAACAAEYCGRQTEEARHHQRQGRGNSAGPHHGRAQTDGCPQNGSRSCNDTGRRSLP